MSDANIIGTKNYQLLISETTELRLLSLPENLRTSLAKSWSTPRAGVKDDEITYRFINYLTSTGLLDDKRETAGKGWRKFSYVECIYLNIVVALRKFGVKTEQIKPIYELFAEQYNDQRGAGYMGLDWLDMLIAVHCGTEFELLVQEDGQVLLLDPPMMRLFGVNATEGSLRISMSATIDRLRTSNGMEPVKIVHSFGRLPLGEAEMNTVIGMRGLKHGQEALHIRRTKSGDTLVETEKVEDVGSEFAEQLGSMLDEDFINVQAIKKNGKVVNVKKTDSRLYKG